MIGGKWKFEKSDAGQILNIDEFYKFCRENIKNIFDILNAAEEIEEEPESHIFNVQTLPGTPSYHHFIPLLIFVYRNFKFA